MSWSPPRNEDISSQRPSQQKNDKLQIRVVPYSPPRISSDGSAVATSRPVSYADSSPLATPSRPPTSIESDQGHSQGSSHQQGPSTQLGVSGLRRLSSSLTTSSAAFDQFDPGNVSITSSRASSPQSRSSRRPKRVISVNSDKTFSLIPQSDTASSSRADSFGSPQPSLTTPSSSWGRASSNVFVDHRSSSPLASQGGRRVSSDCSVPSPEQPLPGSNTTPASHWNYRTREGVSKVDKAPDFKGKQLVFMPSPPDDSLPPLPENNYAEEPTAPRLSAKGSFQTWESDSTLSERTNYKVYGESSPVATIGRETTAAIDDSLPPSSSHSNYQILGESSSSNQSLSDQPRPPTNDSDANYVVHGGPSASCSSLASNRSRLKSEYSRESLVVAPLRPVKKRSFEHAGVFKSRSRESLRRGSLTSLGTTLTQEATRALFASPPSLYPQRRRDSWGAHPDAASNAPNAMVSHLHQWSAPLSTVVSESEGGSAPPSRSLSPFSATDRRSSGHSRNLLSMSSSLAGLDEQMAASPPSRNVSPERPAAALNRNTSREPWVSPRLIRDHDEDGDGLADLEELHHRPSRARLASLVSSNSSDHVLRSSGSTRSLNPFSLPAWARLYYGSGERRFLIAQASSESMRSLYNGSLYNEPPYNNFLHRSPSAERFTSSIRNPRRRPRETAPETEPVKTTDEIRDIPPMVPDQVKRIGCDIKKQTSSIWSPHLRRDRRASRYSIWEPPSAVWSTESGFDWRRNQQVVLFVVGFMIPFAWMVAAFLPLPLKPQLEILQQHHSTSHLDLRHGPAQLTMPIDEARYNSARWWRNLNRGMSIIGFLVIGAVIALIIVGVKHRWGT